MVIPTIGSKRSELLKAAIKSAGDLPIEIEKDTHRTGAGPARNRAISRVDTPWVAFLDDDDELSADFAERFTEATQENPEADLIIFRMRYPEGQIIPKIPVISWGNVGISFACKTSLARKHPFIRGADSFEQNEDYQFIRSAADNGYVITFSPHVTYLVKPSEAAQANARINN